MGDLIPMYRIGNILARRIKLECLLLATRRENIRFDAPKFPNVTFVAKGQGLGRRSP
jgi:hypothetical protein